jgi:hypothetical protein
MNMCEYSANIINYTKFLADLQNLPQPDIYNLVLPDNNTTIETKEPLTEILKFSEETTLNLQFILNYVHNHITNNIFIYIVPIVQSA